MFSHLISMGADRDICIRADSDYRNGGTSKVAAAVRQRREALQWL